MGQRLGAATTDQCGRFRMAVVIIALVSVGLYQLSGRTGAAEPVISDLSLRR
jgi:hypothetical protein